MMGRGNIAPNLRYRGREKVRSFLRAVTAELQDKTCVVFLARYWMRSIHLGSQPLPQARGIGKGARFEFWAKFGCLGV